MCRTRILPSAIVSMAMVLIASGCGPDRLGVADFEDREGILYRIGSDEPFTGVVAEPFPDSVDGVEEGVVARKSTYMEGRLEGARTWHPDGTLESEATFAGGALDGVLTHWFSNGQMRMQKEYRAGQQHGSGKEWYEDGQQMIEGSYSDGRIHGRYRRWHPDGTLAVDAEYHRGQTLRIQLWSETGEPIPIEPDIVLDQDSVR